MYCFSRLYQTDVVFLERDINARKQAFGIEVYDILKSNASTTTTAAATISASDIQKAFEACQADIQHLESKVEAKRGEMRALDGSGSGSGGAGGSVAVEEAEAPGIPSTP